MFRSHSDRRHMPFMSSSPSRGNYMSISSREGLVSAPCVPGSIQSAHNHLARLGNPMIHSHSVPSFSQISQADEISAALGLQTLRVLEYSKPEPVSHYDELIDNLQALNLDSLAVVSMDTAISEVYSRNNHLNVLIDRRGSQASLTRHGDDMSSVEGFGSLKLSSSFQVYDSDGKTGLGLKFGSIVSTAPEKVLSTKIQPLSLDFLSRLARKRLRTPSRQSRRSGSNSPRDLVRALESSGRLSRDQEDTSSPKKSAADMPELQYLVTYNLVNNFYFNLVLWSPVNNSIAIAIEGKAYWWDGSSQVRDMNIQRPGLAPVSCVSCSNGDALAISFSDGYFCIYQIARRRPPVSRRFNSSIQCVEWFPDGKRLFTGDLAGTVCLLAYDGTAILVLCHLTGFTQQICGISLNRDCSQVAVGANENLAIVWDITSETVPREKCRLRHKSAVKGILFCPWAPSLLATGGGSNDRHLRFWHTGSGTLLKELDTKRQITSVFWSSYYKQVMLTFGFLTTDDHVAAATYTYPETQLSAQASSRDPLRALSATIAPDQTKVAIAANDGTVRVFGLWTERPYPLTEAPSFIAAGTYGSSVVESSEGVDFRAPALR